MIFIGVCEIIDVYFSVIGFNGMGIGYFVGNWDISLIVIIFVFLFVSICKY